jgi:methyltransferase (TIGR00027 family)
MKPGQESRTAVIVCMARAVAHGATPGARFSDPTALALLPEDARERVERFRSGVVPKGFRGRWGHVFLERRAKMMVARTVAIDDAVRAAGSPQVVILGAGLDGRAWRMPELRDVKVFEVDHPDSQRQKRARAASLAPMSREVRFVPVDFTRDDLDAALSAAGHDPSVKTTWIWEGVVMYLTVAEIEATLAVIARRSAPGSTLVVAYHSHAPLLYVVAIVVRRLGEPIRSAFSAEAMRALLAKHGFRVTHDEDLPTIAKSLTDEVARATRPMRHLRIATAVREHNPTAR